MKRSLAPSTLIAKKILCSSSLNGTTSTTRNLNSLVELISSNKEKRDDAIPIKPNKKKQQQKKGEDEDNNDNNAEYKTTPTSLTSLLRLANKENIRLDPETGKLISDDDDGNNNDNSNSNSENEDDEADYVEYRNKPITREGECCYYYWGKYAGKKDGRPEVCIVEVGYEQCKVVGLDGKQGARIAIARGAVHDADDEERASQDVSIKGASTKPVYLCYGQTVRFGSKAVALYDEIPAEHYRSGAVFLAKPPDAVLRGDRRKRSEVLKERSAGAADATGKLRAQGHGRVMLAAARRPRGFVCPFKNGNRQQQQRKRGEPLWPVNGPNALVLYAPSLMAKGKVAVVVDPKLSKVLRPHQREGVQFMFDCVMGLKGGFKGNGCILADGMGMGKTIQAITLLWTLLRQGPDGVPAAKKALIVAPSSLVANWGKEIKKWLGGSGDGDSGENGDGASVATVADSSKRSMSDLSDVTYGKAEVLIISYDQLKIHIEEIAKLDDIGLVICDEGHKLKNANIQCAKAVAAIRTRRRVILTGTPIQNDLEEFYAMVNFVNPGVLGDLALFKKVYERPIVNEDQDKDLEAVSRARSEELSRITSQFILRRSNTLNRKYLPPKLEYVVFCALTPFQRDIYERIIGAGSASVEALQIISALRKLCNHPRLLAGENLLHKMYPWLAGMLKAHAKADVLEDSAKLAFLDAIVTNIRKDGDKLVIVSNYTQTLDVLGAWCKKRGYPYFQLDGKTPVLKRQQLVDIFNDKSSSEFIFLLSSKAGGCGLNLIGACHLVMFDPDWNPANDDQAMARVWRDGQKKTVRIYRVLCTGTIEEKIFQRQMTKLALSSQVVDKDMDAYSRSTGDCADSEGAMLGASDPDISPKDLKSLFKLCPESVACDTHDLLCCRCGKGVKPGTVPRKIFAFERGDIKIDALAEWNHLDGPEEAEDEIFKGCPRNLVSFMFSILRDTLADK